MRGEEREPALPPIPDDAALGAVLRRAREQVGITARDMASRVGCSASHISQLERGLTSPSVDMLFKIVWELDLSLDDVFDAVRLKGLSAPSAPRPGLCVRKADRHQMLLRGGVDLELLTPTAEDGFEFVEYVYAVGGTDGDELLRRPGRACGVVLDGKLGCVVGLHELVLEEGDSIAYDSMTPHRFWNAGDVPCRAVWVWHRDYVVGPQPSSVVAARRSAEESRLQPGSQGRVRR